MSTEAVRGDTWLVRRDLSALLIALLLVAVVSATAVAVENAGSSSSPSGTHDRGKVHPVPPPWAHAGGDGRDDERGDKADKADKTDKTDKTDKANKQAWQKYWHGLTPAQRAAKMAQLAQAHADGMKKFAACVKSAGDDKARRAACAKPLPPGLAKKQLR